MVGRRKPAKRGTLLLLVFLVSDRDELLYVGNEAKDVLGAIQAGVPCAFLEDRTGRMTDYGQNHDLFACRAQRHFHAASNRTTMNRREFPEVFGSRLRSNRLRTVCESDHHEHRVRAERTERHWTSRRLLAADRHARLHAGMDPRGLKSVEGLSMAEILDYFHDPKANTIGALLLHLAATERHYQIDTFEGKKMERLG